MTTKFLGRQHSFLNIPILALVFENLAADPSIRPAGAIYWNTSDLKLRISNGTTWEDVGGTMTAAAILAALLTVDGAASGLDADLLDGQQGSYYLNRANHSGSQAASTISDLTSAVQGIIDTYLDVSGAPAALNTLNEIAAALQDNENFYSALVTQINGRADTYRTAAFGNGVLTVFTIANPSGNADARAWIVNNGTSASDYEAEITMDASNITVTFQGYVPTTNQFQLLVHG